MTYVQGIPFETLRGEGWRGVIDNEALEGDREALSGLGMCGVCRGCGMVGLRKGGAETGLDCPSMAVTIT